MHFSNKKDLVPFAFVAILLAAKTLSRKVYINYKDN